MGPTNLMLQLKLSFDICKIHVFLLPKSVPIFFSPGLLTILKILLCDSIISRKKSLIYKVKYFPEKWLLTTWTKDDWVVCATVQSQTLSRWTATTKIRTCSIVEILMIHQIFLLRYFHFISNIHHLVIV